MEPWPDRTGVLLEEEGTAGLPLHHVRAQQGDLLQAKKRLLPEPNHAGTPLPASRTVKK